MPKLVSRLTLSEIKYCKNFPRILCFLTAIKSVPVMPSKGVLEVLRIITNLCYDIVSGIPFKFISQRQGFRNISIHLKTHAAWFASMLIFLFLTVSPIV